MFVLRRLGQHSAGCAAQAGVLLDHQVGAEEEAESGESRTGRAQGGGGLDRRAGPRALGDQSLQVLDSGRSLGNT